MSILAVLERRLGGTGNFNPVEPGDVDAARDDRPDDVSR
jgi:hypothetical protein